MSVRIPFAARQLALATALATVYTQAGAVLVADGKLGDGAVASPHGTAAAAMAEGYTLGWVVGFNDDKGNFIGNGQLWFGTDAVGNQYLYFMLPQDYVDNTYGTNASAGWSNGHTFDDLLKSDSMGASPNFSWNDKAGNYAGAGTNNAAQIDYLANCSAAVDGSCASTLNSGYKSAGVGTGTGVVGGANGGSANWTQMDVALTGTAASILEIATSLEYNLNRVDATATTNSSLNANWLKEVGYEIEFKAGTFDPAKWGQDVRFVNGQVTIPGLLSLGDPHVSPPRTSFGEVSPPRTTFGVYATACVIGSDRSCGAPEPGTTWLLGAGLAGLAWYARRRRKDLGPTLPS